MSTTIFFSFSDTFRRRTNLLQSASLQQIQTIQKYKENGNTICIMFLFCSLLDCFECLLKVWNVITFLQDPKKLTTQIFYETLFYRVVVGLFLPINWLSSAISRLLHWKFKHCLTYHLNGYIHLSISRLSITMSWLLPNQSNPAVKF